jgi:hypothetical protein
MTLLALQDLFRRYREKATGVWTLGRNPGRTVYFDYGDTVFAQSTHLQDRLTHLLVERGKVTQSQMDYALANLKPGLSIGKNLIDMGFITQRDLLEMAKFQVERIVRSALACPDQEPSFEPRELDANVVRLPMNTPQLFLAGILSLQDREGLLELLGPLNQVVVLQGRNLQDLALPADLAKLPPLLDGTHTLLELSRESMAEPMRLGAFALFLRETGWARLHEMPPLDRQALDRVLAPETEPELPAPTLVEPLAEPAPSLFATIQEAARPTTNLEHLSQSLDEPAAFPEPFDAEPRTLVLPEPLEAPEAPEPPLIPGSFRVPEPPPAPGAGQAPEPPSATGQPVPVTLRVPLEPGAGYPPTPVMAIQAVPEIAGEAPVPMVVRTPPMPALVEPPEPAPAPGELGPARRRGGVWLLLLLLFLAGLAGGGWLWVRTRGAAGWPWHGPAPAPSAPAPPPTPAPPAPAPEPPAPAAQPPAAPAATPAPAPEPPQPPEPEETAAKTGDAPVSTSLAARNRALARGDLALAVQQGRRLARSLPPGHYTLRLEIACQGGTIQRLVEVFQGREPDLFVLPMTLKDGRACYQVLYGRFPSSQAAKTEMTRLPHVLLADRNRPRIFRISELLKMK